MHTHIIIYTSVFNFSFSKFIITSIFFFFFKALILKKSYKSNLR